MFDKHQTAAKLLRQIQDQARKLVCFYVVKSSRRFVQKEMSRLQCETSHKRNPTLQSLWQCAGANGSKFGQSAGFEKLGNQLASARSSQMYGRRIHFKILGHR